jgi:hypothetical protein
VDDFQVSISVTSAQYKEFLMRIVYHIVEELEFEIEKKEQLVQDILHIRLILERVDASQFALCKFNY